jgi:arylsulfatase A-like enzyme
MPDKRVAYLIFAFIVAFGLGSCRRTPSTGSPVVRLVDLLEAKNITASPFISGALDPSDQGNFHEKTRPLLDRGALKDPYGIKRKLILQGTDPQGTDLNALVAPPGSAYAFDLDLPASASLEFGAGIVRGGNSEALRQRLAAGDDSVRFQVRIDMSGKTGTLFMKSVDQPPLIDGRGLNLVPERVSLPPAGGRARITLLTEGPDGAFSFWANPVVIRTGQRARRVVLISIDTLRADHVGCYGYGKDTTPHIDALAADGALFSNAYAPSSWTLPSHVSLLTALSCFRHGVNLETDRMEETRPTLADVLRTQGFFCAAVTGGGFLSPVFGFSKGFDVYRQVESSLWTGDAAGQVSAAALDWIDANRDRDFFLFVHTYQPHNPYIPPAPYDTKFQDAPTPLRMIDLGGHLGGPGGIFKPLPEAERRAILGLYDGEVGYTDAALVGALTAKLKALGIYDDTLIVLTSDHGEEFYEHGSWEHGHSLYDESLKVPLIVKFPGSKFRGKRVASFVRLVDVMPTILEAFDIGADWLGLDGRGLIEVLRGREKEDRAVLAHLAGGVLSNAVPARTCLTDGRMKVILNSPYGAAGSFLSPPPVVPGIEAYDLAADPGERTEIASRKARDAARLVLIMRELERAGRKPAGQKTGIDAETEEKLRALGYIR